MFESENFFDASSVVGMDARNPFMLPSNAQLLSYCLYQTKRAENQLRDPSLSIVPQRSVLARREREAKEKRRVAHDDSMKELRKSTGPTGFSTSRYVLQMRQLSIWRLIVGQKRDARIQLDQEHNIEQSKYLYIKREYKSCAAALESYLAKDHDASMQALSNAESELKRTIELSERRDELSRLYGQTRLQVYRCEEAWRTVRACQSFLRRVSPLRGDDESLLDGDEASQPDDHSELDVKLKDERPSEVGQMGSLESIIASFEKEAIEIDAAKDSVLKTPEELGLAEPADLMRHLRDIELQNLNALIHSESLTGPMADMIARINVAEVRVKREIDDVLEGIEHLEKAIKREEVRAKRLQQHSKQLVQRQFRALICSPEALQVRILIEEAYESCIAKNEAGLDSLAMTRGLEDAYEKLSAELDSMPRHLVLICERDGFQQELKQNREAQDAARKFELMQRLLAALRRIMEPSQPKRRMLMRRSLPKTQRRRAKSDKGLKRSSSAREALMYKELFFSKIDDDDDEKDESVAA